MTNSRRPKIKTSYGMGASNAVAMILLCAKDKAAPTLKKVSAEAEAMERVKRAGEKGSVSLKKLRAEIERIGREDDRRGRKRGSS